MRILAVNQNPEINRLIKSIAELDGHVQLTTRNAGEARALYARYAPDLVLVDLRLGQEDGYETAAILRGQDERPHIPMLLLDSVSDGLDYDRFVGSGASDFVETPLSAGTLRAKIRGAEKIQAHFSRMENIQARSHQEVILAKHMFDTVISRSPDDVDFLSHWSMAAGNFSGDMLIYERGPNNDLYALMADFTGHGFSAAVGALPISDVFFAMVKKGFGLDAIAREMNKKLNELLPVGYFCAASLIKLCTKKQTMEVWIGGQPGIWLLYDEGHQHVVIDSCHLPLGVLSDEEFSSQPQNYELSGIDQIVLFSDGLLDAQNAFGEYFGEEGVLHSVKLAMSHGKHLVNHVKRGLLTFMGGLNPHDDVSLLALNIAK